MTRRYRAPGTADIDGRDRFWKFVDKSNPDGCWPWTGAKSNGYGFFSVYSKMYRATRYMIYLKTGEFPSDCVLHKCNNPPCVNPDHLYVGSRTDNWDDRRREHANKRDNRTFEEEG